MSDSDIDIATRAPESDALEDSKRPPTSSAPPTQPKPTMCDDCTSDRPTPSGQLPIGELTKLNDIDPRGGRDRGRGLLLLNRGESFLDMFKIKAVETVQSFRIDMWLARHTEERVMPLLARVLEDEEEFADAVAHGGGVYAVGYCFGARYVLLLAREGNGRGRGDEEAGVEKPQIRAGALAHATLVSKGDFVGLRAPRWLALGQNSADKKAGFAVVGDYEDSHIKTAQATAFDQMLQWINEH
ncbi:hypothetical protein N0V88_000926 [Collariella sp. IMI 366227]|nr:hypothetical protein N0V88_000926 [Collariella sp. IMI 366227]